MVHSEIVNKHKYINYSLAKIFLGLELEVMVGDFNAFVNTIVPEEVVKPYHEGTDN